MFLDIERIKKHLNIDAEFVDDDEYLATLGEVAETVVQKHIDEDLTVIAAKNGGELPPPLLHAMLLFAGSMYQSREVNSLGSLQEVPFGFDYILSLYKNYTSNKQGNNDGGCSV